MRGKWNGPAAWAAKEQKAGDRLPYAAHVDEATIRLRDGSLMRGIHLDGLSFETADTEDLNSGLAMREVLLRSALDSRFVLYHHIVRRRVRAEIEGEFDQPFAAELDRAWRERLSERRLFVNEQFLTVVRRPARGKTGWPERVSRMLGRATGEDPVDSGARRDLDAAVASLLAGLQPYGARLLGGYQGQGGRCSEPLELLSALYNGEFRAVLTPPADVDLGRHVPYCRVSFGLDALEVQGPQGRSWAGLLSVKEYPGDTRPGLTDGLLRLPHELVLTETFAPAERQVARERIDLALRRLRASDDDGVTERREMLSAKDALNAGQAGFGDHHLSVLVRASELDALDPAVAEAASALADVGAVAVREDVNLEPAFWGQFPGNEAYVVRKALISTTNAAGFMSLHGFPLGQPAGNLWGPAVSVLETTSATPYFFNFHRGDLGHFTVIGPSGSGKTVAMNFLAAQAQRKSGDQSAPRLTMFDKDRGAEIFIRAMEGRYARLVPGEASGFNPLKLPDTAGNRAFLRDWLGALLNAEGVEEAATISAAVDACFEHDAAFRRLRHFGELLGGGRRPEPGDLAARLQPWINNGEHAWLFDNADDGLDLDQRVLGFDMTELLDSPAVRTPAMMYLFHRVDERLTGEPAMIVIDEGWKALDDEVFAARLRDWLKTLRKRNCIVGFGTQSARDALDSRIAAAVVEQTPTQIFMPNAKARPEDYCDGFGLSEHELELVRTLPPRSHCFLIRHAEHSVVVRLDLSGMPDLLTVLSGRESTVRRLDAARAQVGDSPADWWPLVVGARWPGDRSEGPWLEAAE